MSSKEKKTPSSTSPCAQLRAAYHDCFNRWYSEKFMKGQWDKDECANHWQKYRDCLSQHLEDKHLRRFLEAESGQIDGAATGRNIRE
ncbi:Mitochondrial distribution/morphology family 35/apoptosis, partial [Dillenia turbinata]